MSATLNRLALVAALAAATVVTYLGATIAPAQAAGECVGHGEFDRMERGMSVNQVARLFDLYGNYIGDDDGDQRRAYRTCWAPGERRVIVEFDYDSGNSRDWYIRDTPWS